MIPYRVRRVFATPYIACQTHVANVIETKVSDAWDEIPTFSIEVQRRGYPVVTLLVHELPFGTSRGEAAMQATALVGITARSDRDGRFGMTDGQEAA